MGEQRVSGFGMQMTAQRLTFAQHVPIEALTWLLSDDGKSVRVSIGASQRSKIDRSYLADADLFIGGAFRYLVLEGANDVTARLS